jgi:FkbM family methyltransferase
MLPRVNLIRTNETDYLMFSTADAISTTVYTNGYWAKLIMDISLTFCSGIDSPFVLDIGANLGAYAIPVAQKIASVNGTVFAYEPQRIVFYQLCGNVFLNRLDNIHAFHMAVGDLDGKVNIRNIDYARTSNIGGFSLDNSLYGRTAITEAEGSYEVAMTRLDSIVLPNAPSLIKIDVEGAELDVLKGANKTICDANFPPLILEAWTSEWFRHQREMLLSHLETMGYSYFLLGDEIFAQHPGHARQFEFGSNGGAELQMLRVR